MIVGLVGGDGGDDVMMVVMTTMVVMIVMVVMVMVATASRLIPHRMQLSKRYLSESFTTQSALR